MHTHNAGEMENGMVMSEGRKIPPTNEDYANAFYLRHSEPNWFMAHSLRTLLQALLNILIAKQSREAHA